MAAPVTIPGISNTWTPDSVPSDAYWELGSGTQPPGLGSARILASQVITGARNVIAYGADPTGGVDCTSAVIAAIGTGGRTVVFPPGIYLVGAGNGINILVDDVDLVFQRGAYLRKSGAGAAITLARAAATTINRIGIYGARITTPSTNVANAGIVIAPDAGNAAHYVTIDDFIISGMGQYGIVSGGAVGDHNYLNIRNGFILNNGAVTGNWVRQAMVIRPTATSTNFFMSNVYVEQINDGTGLTDGCKIQLCKEVSIVNFTVKGGNVSTLVLDGMEDWVVSNVTVIGTGGSGLAFQSTATGRNELSNFVIKGTFGSSNAIVLGANGCHHTALRNFWAGGQLMGAINSSHSFLTFENGWLDEAIRFDTEANVAVDDSFFSNLRSRDKLFWIIGDRNEINGLRNKASPSNGIVVQGDDNVITSNRFLDPVASGIYVAGDGNTVDQNYVRGPGVGHVNVASGTANEIGVLFGNRTITDAGTGTVRTLTSVPLIVAKGTYTDGDTTPTVFGINQLQIANTSPTVITNFDNAALGQVIELAFSDANTTVNRSNAVLAGGANFVSTAGSTLVLRQGPSFWEEVSRSLNS